MPKTHSPTSKHKRAIWHSATRDYVNHLRRRGELTVEVASVAGAHHPSANQADAARVERIMLDALTTLMATVVAGLNGVPVTEDDRKRQVVHAKGHVQQLQPDPLAAQRALDWLEHKAELLAVGRLPIINALAIACQQTPGLTDTAVDSVVDDLSRRLRIATVQSTSASAVARIRGGRIVTWMSMRGYDDPFIGITAKVETRRAIPSPASVETVLEVRQSYRSSPAFHASHANEINRLMTISRDLRRGTANLDEFFDLWWYLERSVDASVAIDPPTHAVLNRRATRTAMIARLNEVLTLHGCGTAVPNFVGWVEAGLELASVASSGHEARRWFDAALRDATTFVDRERVTIDALARALSACGELVEPEIRRIVGTP